MDDKTVVCIWYGTPEHYGKMTLLLQTTLIGMALSSLDKIFGLLLLNYGVNRDSFVTVDRCISELLKSNDDKILKKARAVSKHWEQAKKKYARYIW